MTDTASNLLLPLTPPLALPRLRVAEPVQPAELIPAYLTWKPAAEVVMAALLLVLLAPVVLVAAVLVRLTSRGPAFYSQQRVGRGGRSFVIY